MKRRKKAHVAPDVMVPPRQAARILAAINEQRRAEETMNLAAAGLARAHQSTAALVDAVAEGLGCDLTPKRGMKWNLVDGPKEGTLVLRYGPPMSPPGSVVPLKGEKKAT